MSQPTKFKNDIRVEGNVQLPAETAERALIIDASGEIASSVVTSTELGHLAGVTSSVQDQLDAAQGAADGAQTAIDNHIADTTDAHDASAISVVPAGNLAATDVQAALEELQGDINDLDTRISDVETDVTDLITLTGVPANSTDLGTFTGSIIPDASDIKEALQALETEIETLPVGSAGDIQEASFAMSNNQAAPANVTGLAFASGVVRSFTALVSVEIDATVDLYEQFTLNGINKGGSFDMSVYAVGDNSGVTFSITSAGQVQYTSGNAAGFVSGSIKFRAITTSV